MGIEEQKDISLSTMVQAGKGGEYFPYGLLYDVFGWTFFLAWGISFYPQVFKNRNNKSSVGMSVAFQWYNLLGFGLYSYYVFSLASNADTRRFVTIYDMGFWAHAVLLTFITMCQVHHYYRKSNDKWNENHIFLSVPMGHAATKSGLVLILILAYVFNENLREVLEPFVQKYFPEMVQLNPFLQICGLTKVVISVLKYVPQVALNFRRWSTQGFAMHVVYLDLTGAFFNNMQQLVMCTYDKKSETMRDKWTWAPLINNPIKLLISMASYVFCFVYLLQHHILFGAREPRVIGDGTRTGGSGSAREGRGSAFSNSGRSGRGDVESDGADYGAVVVAEAAGGTDQDNPRRNLLVKEQARG